MDIDELATLINSDTDIEGITLSGGEPLDYPEQLTCLLRKVAERLTVIIFSGYMIHEIRQSHLLMSVVGMADLSIVGRYDERLAHPYYGKKFIVSRGRIDVNHFKPRVAVEYSVNNKSVTKTGIFK